MILLLISIIGLFLASILTLIIPRFYSKGSALIVFFTALNLIASVYFLTISQNLLTSFPWIKIADITFTIDINLDLLAKIMYFVVSLVSLMVVIYSLKYLAEDEKKQRFFSFLGFFIGTMFGVIISNNLLTFFVFWELMGLSSYLLIGFWHEKKSAALSAKKAFLVTKLADLALFLVILIIYTETGTLRLSDLATKVNHLPLMLLTTISLLIIIGVCGKSAQGPFFVWLPSAMEGPTPVSALIHAATMVAAGIYLIGRLIFLFTPFTLKLLLIIGAVTALMSALIALTQQDIKKVLAFSTISQLGLMMAALGAGQISSALFHLTTHAFFKALLFLVAGVFVYYYHQSKIPDLNKENINIPLAEKTFLVGAFALAGIPPFAGFFSKEKILSAVLSTDKIIFALILLINFLTAVYIFRLYFLLFPRQNKSNPPKISSLLSWPLIILSLFSLVAGFIYFPGIFSKLTPPVFIAPALQSLYQNQIIADHFNFGLIFLSIIIALSGFILSYFIYGRKSIINKTPPSLIKLAYNQFYFNELYSLIIIKPLNILAKITRGIDEFVINGFINLIKFFTIKIADLSKIFDQKIIDNLVDFSGKGAVQLSKIIRRVQTGEVRFYLFVYIIGALFLIYTLNFR